MRKASPGPPRERRPPRITRRWAAFGVDYLWFAAYMVLLAAGGLAARTALAGMFSRPVSAETVGFLTLTLPVVLYFTLTEGGAGGATWGKRRLGLRVVRTDGDRAGYGRALIRSAVKFLPWELAHASVWRLALHVSTASAEAGAITALALAAVWVFSPFSSPAGRAVYDWVAGTVVIAADGAEVAGDASHLPASP